MLLSLIASSCCAQYYFKHYEVEDGLVQNSVISLLQDSRGFMWIGTRGGLNRFDGYTFKTYKDPDNKYGSIGNNAIHAIAEDKNGMLWIGTGTCLVKFDPVKESFTVLRYLRQTYISQVITDGQSNVWILSNNTLYKYDQRLKKLINFNIHASCICIDQDDQLWTGTDDGEVVIYNTAGRLVKNIQIIDRKTAKSARSISKLYPVNKDLMLIGCFKQGLKSYAPSSGSIMALLGPKQGNTDIYVRDIAAGDQGRFWIATESGIYIYDPKSKKSQNLHKEPSNAYSLDDNAIYTICKDGEGGMWVGTYFGGLNYYSKENALFEKYYPLQGTNYISGDAIGKICSDAAGKLWIGTEDAGINRFDPVTKRFTHYTATGKRGAISYPNVHGLLAVGHQLFIGTFLHGLEIMDINTGQVTDRFRFVGEQNGQSSDFVQSIYQTRDGTILIGTAYNGSGLFVYDRKRKTFNRVPYIPYNSYVFDIKEDSKGNIWTGSVASGAYYYNPKTGHHGNFRFGDTVNNEIINEFAVRNIFEDSNHAMWFATSGGGLIRLSADHKVIKRFNTTSGLPSNVVFCILEDNSKHLWISSLKGLICFDLRTERCKTYTESNGLKTDQFNFNSAYKDASGKMYFGSIKGMVAFNPSHFFNHINCPPTFITDFQINNKETVIGVKGSALKKSIIFTDTVLLAHDQNNFSIEFAALNYSSPKVTRYKYCMKGLDKRWTYLYTNRKAFFTDLSPGKYQFTVQAESNTGNWTGKQRNIYIEILPPFWKTSTAYVLYAIMLITIFYVALLKYHQFQDAKNSNKLKLFEHEKEKEVYHAKIEFFTNIAHEIQTPLTLISVPVSRVINQADGLPAIKKNLLLIEKYTKRLIDLTTQLLDFRQTEMEQFGLNFVNVDINSLLTEVVASFSNLAHENKIDIITDIPKEPVIAFVDQEALLKICSNLVSNAVKYGRSHIEVRLSHPVGDSCFTITFTNDGKGIPEEYREKIFEPFFRLRSKEKPGTGIGLSLAKSLTELHNGSLKLISAEADHIVLELKIPVHQHIEFNLSNWKKL